MLIKCALKFAETEPHLEIVHQWFSSDSVCDVKLTKEIQHMMVPKIFSSRTITQEHKNAAFERLKSIDDSDKLGLTEKHCQAIVPTLEAKQAVWDKLFSDEVEKLSLYQVEELCGGFRQFG